MRMTSSSSGPAAERFSLVRRGYSPEEVGSFVQKLERELEGARQERASATKEVAGLRAEVDELHRSLDNARAAASSAHTDAEALRAELDRQASQPVTMSSLSARMQRLLQIAEEESAEIRSAANRYRDETRAKADADTSALRQLTESETTKLRNDTEAELTKMRADLVSEIDRARRDR